MRSGETITSDSIEPIGEYPVYGGGALRGYTSTYTHNGHYVLIGRQGAHCGNVKTIKGKLWASEHSVVVTPNSTTDIGWLGYLLESMNLNQYSMSAAQPGLSVSMIKNLDVSCPSIDVQKETTNFITSRISLIEDLVLKKERLILLLEEKRQAMITEAVTKGLNPNVKMKDSGVEWIGEIPEHWEVKKIKHLSNIRRGASPRPIDNPIYFDEEGEYAWVRIADVSASDMYLTQTTQRLSDIGSNLSVKMEPGSMFLSIAGTVGKPCITNIKCCIHDGFVYFPNYKQNIKYLYFLFDTGEPYKGLGKMGTQLNLNTDTVGTIRIPVPPNHEQDDLVIYIEKRVNEYNSLIGKVEHQVFKLKEYRQSIIYEAVTGKIDVRDFEVEQ